MSHVPLTGSWKPLISKWPDVTKIPIRKMRRGHSKTLYQNDFKHLAFFSTLSEGYKCNRLCEITPKERFLREPVKTNFKLIQTSQNEIFYLRFLSSCEIWNLFSWAPLRNCLWCYYRWLITSIALEKCKRECDIAENILIQGFFPLNC